MIRALLWDVDGTLAETERYGHLAAFNRAFDEAAVPWRWSERRYGELLAVTGGRERLLHDMQIRPAAPSTAAAREALAHELHRLKNRHYEQIVSRGELPLRAGVTELIDECRAAGVRLGIVTTTGRGNVAALLARQLGESWAEQFAVTVCAEEAPRKKPDPQAYLQALAALRLGAQETVAVEDSVAGLTAARRAGVPVVVTRSYYFPATAGEGALAVGPSLGSARGWEPHVADGAPRVTLRQIARWHLEYQRAGLTVS